MSWSEVRRIHEEQQLWNRIENSRKKVGLDKTIQDLGLDGALLAEATKRQSIDDQWDTAKPRHWKNNFSGERRMLYSIIGGEEAIQCLVGGTFRADTKRLHKHRGVVVATDKRVVFVDKGIIGSTETQEMPYRNIEAITYSTGMFAGGIQITGLGASSFRIEDIMDKETMQPFVECVRGHVEDAAQPTPSIPPSAAAESSLDDLERLAALYEKGILTEEEFSTKKKQMLGIVISP